MRHALDGETLIVSGLLRNPTATATPALSAVVSVLGPDGQIVARGESRLDPAMLEPGKETNFRVSVPRVAEPGRYRVAFVNGSHIVPHVDRRVDCRERLWRMTHAEIDHAHSTLARPARRGRGGRCDGAQSQEGFRLQERRRARQRHRDGHRRQWPFVSGLRQKTSSSTRTDRARRSRTSAASACRSASASCSTRAAAWPAEKIRRRAAAIDRFIYDLLGKDDELFFIGSQRAPSCCRAGPPIAALISRALGASTPTGGTAMYDAVAEACRLAQRRAQPEEGAARHLRRQRHEQRRSVVRELRQQIRESEVLVYAIGIDGTATRRATPVVPPPSRIPLPMPFPFPGGRGGGGRRFPPIGAAAAAASWPTDAAAIA